MSIGRSAKSRGKEGAIVATGWCGPSRHPARAMAAASTKIGAAARAEGEKGLARGRRLVAAPANPLKAGAGAWRNETQIIGARRRLAAEAWDSSDGRGRT